MNQPAAIAVTGYFDSSALVKRYLVENGTPWVQTWCDDPAHTVAVAEIGLVEIAAAFGSAPSTAATRSSCGEAGKCFSL